MGTLFFAILQMVGDSVFAVLAACLSAVSSFLRFVIGERASFCEKHGGVWQTKIWSQYNY